MVKSNYIVPFFLVVGFHLMMGQTVDVKGQVVANDDVDGIHVLNNTSNTFTITNSRGEFSIPAKLNDTLAFSGVSYLLKKVVVGQDMINSKAMTVYLTEKINALDEVVVGKILTGDLSSDLLNSGVEREINFFDLGIPGYVGKPKTQNERRLYDADYGKYFYFYGLSAAVNVNKILNRLSGNTKKLEHRVYLETKDKCLSIARSNLSEILFKAHFLEKTHRNEFFYFCADDSKFDTLCTINDDFKMLEFLKEKLISFKSNLQLKSEK